MISNKTINILGAQACQELTYDPTEWNTMLIQWSTVSNGEDRCFFYLNERRGFFQPQMYEEKSRDLYIGGHPERGECAPIHLTRFDVYKRDWSGTGEIDNYLVPREICELILNDIMINDM